MLAPWKNSYVKLRLCFKKQDIILLTKVHIVNAIVFPVVRYGCEIWTIKEAECQRIDSFELWCWRRPLGVPWTARTSNQSILKKINPEYSLEGVMLQLEAPMLWPPDGNRRLVGRNPDAGENWGRDDKGVTEDEVVGWHHWLSGHEFEHTCGDSDGQRSLTCCSLWGHKELDTT